MMTWTHRFICLTTTVTFALLAAGQDCPPGYPFAYYYGKYCCASNMEKDCLGDGCKGGFIRYESKCCRDDMFVKCENGPCKNHGVCTSEECKKASKRLSDFMDPTTNPCEDFAKFACGKFQETTVLPDGVPRMSAAFSPLIGILYERGKQLLEEEPKEESPFETDKLARDFYKSCMDLKRIERVGVSPVKRILEKLGRFPALQGDSWIGRGYEWWKVVPQLASYGISTDVILSFYTSPDVKNTQSRAMYLDQPTLGERRSTLINGFNHPTVQHYYKYMVDSAMLYGAKKDIAQKDMKQALQFEIGLANISASLAERRDEFKLYNKKTIRDLEGQPGYPPSLKAYIDQIFASAGVSEINVLESDAVIVRNPGYAKKLSELLADTSARTIANYISWRVVQKMNPLMDSASRSLLEEYERKTKDVKKPSPRWRVCTRAVGFNVNARRLNLAAGSLYARKYLKRNDQEIADNMVTDIRNAFKPFLENNDWMDEETRKSAVEKLDAMGQTIGYPRAILKHQVLNSFFKGLKMTDSYLDNYLEILKFWTGHDLGMLEKPVDKSHFAYHQWIAMVNLFNVPRLNSIECPAGFLNGNLFNPKLPKYMNYGAIGSGIGHEITNGFSNRGRHHDKHGNLVNWWKKTTDQKFRNRAKCFIDQYGSYRSERVGLNINGENTFTVNIADIGGARAAYNAYREYDKRHGPEKILVGHNYSPNQLFWISFAHNWCFVYTDDNLKQLILRASHPPAKFRVWGSVSNNYNFAKDFGCSLGTQMNPVDKCRMW